MSKPKNKNVTNGNKKVKNSHLVLKVWAYAHVVKTLNGSMPRSNLSYFLRLAPILYTYEGYSKGDNKKKVIKEESSEVYALKGMKGAIRHASMKIAYENNYEVCHTSDKTKDKEGRNLLPNGFHQLGSCKDNGECLIHQIYGARGIRSLITVQTLPITSIDQASATIPIQVQNVHIATENRNCLSFEKQSIQDYREKYFSGEFSFEIDVTKLNSLQLGFILNSVAHLDQIGRGATAGYGKVEIKKITLVERITKKRLVQKEDGFIFEDVISEKILKKEVIKAWEAFNVFIKDGSGN